MSDVDPYIAAAIVSSNTAGQIEGAKIQQRAQLIGDMYGTKPPTLNEYLKETGQTPRWGKILLSAAIGAALVTGGLAAVSLFSAGAMAMSAVTAIPATTYAVGAAIGGLIGVTRRLSMDAAKGTANYEQFLGDFAQKSRLSHEARLRQQTIEAVHASQGNGKEWTKTLDQERANVRPLGIT